MTRHLPIDFRQEGLQGRCRVIRCQEYIPGRTMPVAGMQERPALTKDGMRRNDKGQHTHEALAHVGEATHPAFVRP
jgi:hypothetical protein